MNISGLHLLSVVYSVIFCWLFRATESSQLFPVASGPLDLFATVAGIQAVTNLMKVEPFREDAVFISHYIMVKTILFVLLTLALSQDPLLAIFGLGRLTDSLGSQCSQDEELTFSCLNVYKEPESDKLSTNKRKPLVNQSCTDKQVNHVKSNNNQTVSPDAVCHSSKEDINVESNHGSLDLFSSQPTHGSLIEEHIDITLQVNHKIIR